MKTSSFVFLILMLSLSASLCTSNPTFSNQTDQIALFAFKGSITQDPLGALSSWNNSVNLCQWHGVKCGRRHRRVVELDLRSQKLAGSISPFIGNLSFLRSIYLQQNLFRGSIPREIGHLSRLQNLNFSLNTLQGEIPSNLTHCLELRVIDLGKNGLVGKIPAAFGSLSKLTELTLHSNNLHGIIPPSFGNLSLLEIISLGINNLEGTIPESIGRLRHLRHFGIGPNNISGAVPPSIYNISSLENLFLLDNQLKGSLPSDIGFTLPNLVSVSVGGNQFTGHFPASFSNVSGLRMLDLFSSGLIGLVPVDLGRRLNDLRWLGLGENNLGELPMTLGSCLKLERLLLSSNSFNGSIPSSFASLKGPVELDLSHNNLSGTIPIDLQKLSSLQKLNLSFNNLEGEMPLKGSFTNTSVISIVGNKNLCGGVPALHLPTCPILESKKQNNRLGSKVIIIIISVGLCLVILMFVFVIYRKRKPRKAPSETPLGGEFLRVSYDELLKATDGFSLNNLLGVGGFGSVYKGILQQNEKPIAVKVFNLEQLGASESFITECEALRKIRHRNLLKIITACSSINFEGSDFKALVFEFMQNGSLESRLHPSENTTRKLNLTQRLNIAIDVISGLEYLHHHCETPIVHCDLKPSNVLLDEEMTAHVGDFGLAKFMAKDISNRTEQHTNSIAIKGSIGYIAPEYGMGEPISAHGDIYSYGILLLEILTGKRPTDEMFKDGLNLHSFCKMALPDRVMEVADSCLLILDEELNDQTNRSRGKVKVSKCLISLVTIGVACSTETPHERMGISEIVMELNAIKQAFLGMGIHGQRRVRMQLAGQGTSQLDNV